MERPPISVLLPTTTWTSACRQVAEQLQDDDELLLLCDHESDPVAERTDLTPAVSVIPAGDPDGCSGKANAVDRGMDRASHDRIVWTDDDFDHPPDWLDTLSADYDRHGPVSEVPFFRGEDPLSVFLEPTNVFGGTLTTWLGDIPWGGSVIFERDDLDIEAFRADLRRTVSDDGTLGEHLEMTTLKRVREVSAGGTVRESLERFVRFIKIVRFHGPAITAFNALALLAITTALVSFPLLTTVGVTLSYGLVYAAFGIRRWTFLLAVPATVVNLPLFAYALVRRTFVWGGRRYRWRSMFDVEIVE
ncbi:glycosyl transferase protein [Halorhabdus tiamatea SARL4B]|uniref:Glycosyl transferase protein n=1 Tax=Halorhabdus tiamatea SARL4B TaxID=1033806 RepID=F7PM15_9EURY|nr:glycosyltransferase [Halorhabdus tiamatea]ERJ06376.1 glycosyl transferase protein [Halorhabdus tiamatea SARL4B]CCQ34544.1 glycosyltransferase [Halorhabdus tiamatea SARL4B]